MSTGFAPNSCAPDTRFHPLCAAITAPDARADDCRRKVTVSQDRVTIERSYQGIAMRVSVPIESYLGVSVTLMAAGAGLIYQIRLSHRDAELSVPLAEAPDDDEIWADWRSWARFLRLPALVERNDGLAVWGRNPGLVAAAKRRAKRRRPGFLLRRFANPGIARVVHRDAEIIARR